MLTAPAKIDELLRQFWGFEALRPHQREVIDAALQGEDALIVMPTGGGKSLCFQLPPLLDGGLTLVVSPLIALMKDQVDALRVIGYPAAALNSALSASESNEIHRKARNGELKLLYVSPERLVSSEFLGFLKEANQGQGVARVAVDEAHCISAWGHDFRPEYRQLGLLKQQFPQAPLHAFTATATPRVQADVIEQLRLDQPKKIIGTFDRPNLTYRVLAKDNGLATMVDAVRRYPNEGVIIYCVSRKDTERVAQGLIQDGIQARAYHAGLEASERSQISEAFAQERLNVVVATIAFGMGIDRANVRCVIHDSMPRSIEGYQQETGRAGRDGLPSECLMLYSNGDLVKWKEVTSRSHSGDQADHILAMLEEVRRFATGLSCRHRFLSEYFGQHYPDQNCGACDRCLDGLKTVENGTKIAHRMLVTVRDLQAIGQGFGFGIAHLAGVLTGANRKNIRDRGHHSVRGFGMLRDQNLVRVTAWIHQLLDQGLLGQTSGRYPTVFLTEAGSKSLLDRAEVQLAVTAAMEGKPTTAHSDQIQLSDHDRGLFERMREVRREIAVEQALPAYVILHDATLMNLATARPTSVEAIRQIPGFGEKRASNLGTRWVQAIIDYCHENGLETDREAASVVVKSSPKTVRGADLFEQGLSIAQVAQAAGLAESTVGGHLITWIEHARPKSIEPWVPAETYKEILGALHHSEDGRLRPIFEALNASEISAERPPRIKYEQIRAVITHLRVLREA